jgi:hypothetical protein
MSNQATALTHLETASAVVSTTRPTDNTHGVSLAAWLVANIRYVNATWIIKSDGTNCTIDSPTGGANGVEVWVYKANKAGVSSWLLVGYLMGGDIVPIVAASGGAAGPLLMIASATRVCIAGTPTVGRSPTYTIEPVEVQS